MYKIIPLQGTACESNAKLNKKKEIETYSNLKNTNLTEKGNLTCTDLVIHKKKKKKCVI